MDLGRLLAALRRTLLAVVGIPVVIALAMSFVDSYRRRGKKPKPFPVVAAAHGDGRRRHVTTYTYGRDLYDDMLAAIEGAKRQILFETYIWKGDATGERFKRALAAAADRGRGGLLHLRRLRQPRRVAGLQALPQQHEGAALPRLLRRAGASSTCAATAATTARSSSSTTTPASWAATTSARPTRRSGATPTSGSPEPGSGTSSARSPTSGTSTGAAGCATASARCCSRPPPPGSPRSGCSATSRGCGCSPSGRCTSRRSTGPAATSG